MNSLHTHFGRYVFEYAATTVQVARHIAHIGVGGEHFEFHHRFEQHGVGFTASSFETNFGAHFKRQLVGVHRVERTVDDAYFHTVHRIACEHAVEHSSLEAFFYGRYELFGNVAAFHVVDALQTLYSLVGRANCEEYVGKLTFTTGLLFVDLVVLHCGGDGFFVCHFGTALVDVDAKFATQTVQNDIQMKFAHTADDGLSGHFVGFHAESGVFFCQFHQSVVELVGVGLGEGFHSDANHRFGELHRFKDNGVLLIAEGMTRFDFLETYSCSDIAGFNASQRILLVGVHLHDAGDPFFFASVDVVHIGA